MQDVKRNSTIDCLKGLSILFIIITHFDNYQSGITLKLLYPFWISMAVPIFMVISGYVNAESISRKHLNSLTDLYKPFEIIRKILRYSVPYALFFSLEWVIILIQGEAIPSLRHIVFTFCKGGYGKGSYYYPVLLQLVFIYPLIYITIVKYHFKGVLLIGALNYAYEILKTAINMPDSIYRILVFRYLLVIAIGCYASIRESRSLNFKWICVSSVGFIYILLIRYCGLKPIFTTMWSGTSLWASLYIAPIIIECIYKNRIHIPVLELVGKASYDIFLFQMLFYYCFSNRIYDYIKNTILQLIACLLICVLGGLALYKIEVPLSNQIIILLSKTRLKSK